MKANQLRLGAILSYVTLFLNNILAFVYTPIMIRFIGQSEYGLYALIGSLIGYLTILDFGFGNAIIRYVSKYKTIGDKEKEYSINGMFAAVYSIIGVITVIIGIIIYLNAKNIFNDSLTEHEIKTAKIMILILTLNMAISLPANIFSSLLKAYERFVFPNIMSILRCIILPLITLPLLIGGYKSVMLVVVNTILNLATIGINMYYCFTKLEIKIYFKGFDIPLLKEITNYSFFIFLNIIMDQIYWKTDQLVLGVISGTVAVAVYSIASQFITYYMAFSTAISGVFLPKMTELVTREVPIKVLTEYFIKIGRIQFIIMSFILSGFILFGKPFIEIWVGRGYERAYYIAIIVMIPLLIPLCQNIGISILQAKNMHSTRALVYFAIALLNFTISIPLAKLYGGFGCALGTSLSLILGQIIFMNLYYHIKVKLDIIQYWKQTIKLLPSLLTALAAGYLINEVIVSNSIMFIIIKIGIFSAIYFLITWIIGMNNYEKELIREPLKRILSIRKRHVNAKAIS